MYVEVEFSNYLKGDHTAGGLKKKVRDIYDDGGKKILLNVPLRRYTSILLDS